MKGKGHWNESERHSLQARGIETKVTLLPKVQKLKDEKIVEGKQATYHISRDNAHFHNQYISITDPVNGNAVVLWAKDDIANIIFYMLEDPKLVKQVLEGRVFPIHTWVVNGEKVISMSSSVEIEIPKDSALFGFPEDYVGNETLYEKHKNDKYFLERIEDYNKIVAQVKEYIKSGDGYRYNKKYLRNENIYLQQLLKGDNVEEYNKRTWTENIKLKEKILNKYFSD
jgi:hypothetical protein